MTRTTPELVPCPSFHTTPVGGHLATAWRATGTIFWRTSDLLGNRVSSLEPSGPKVESLPLGHFGRLEWLKEKNLKHNNSEIKRKHKSDITKFKRK
ncbi:hypothetical protein AVEN_213762-1 [Araneus ventricosus]|uniref:Uncharacterized protein n=1 Tax=Araneus ventricosus TaxID=182803 RepID=A0A4Y2JPI0_ARAVE|nr:hypothetical protein AVEN_213762-1 [Araneus ventricosus]